MATILTRNRNIRVSRSTPGRTRRFPTGVRKLVRSSHVVAAVGWTGRVVAMLVVGTSVALSDDPRTADVGYDLMERVSAVFIPVFAVSTVITGVALSLGTAWGLSRHRWVLVKVVIAGMVIATAASVQSRWVSRAAEEGADPWLVVAGSATHLTLLVAATVISVEKPWGRVRRGPVRSRPR